MRFLRRFVLVSSFLLALFGCADDSSGPAPGAGAGGSDAGAAGTSGSGGARGGSAGAGSGTAGSGAVSGGDAGGSDAGGSDAGGSDAGGSDAGGSDAGGSDAGGSDAGGSDAGGSSGSGGDGAGSGGRLASGGTANGGASGDSNPGGGGNGGVDNPGGAGESGDGGTVQGGTSQGGVGGSSLATNGWVWAAQSDDRLDSNVLVTAVSTQPSGAATFVAGSLRGTPTFGAMMFESAGEGDVFLAKYNVDGSVAWAVRAGGEADDEATSVSALADGGAYVTGRFRGSASFGTTTLTVPWMTGVFLAKYDANGAVVWAIRVGDNDYEYGNPVVSALADGGVYLSEVFGSQGPFGSIPLVNAGAYDTLVAKYTATGSLAWAVGMGGGGDDIPVAIATLADGSAFVTGTFTGSAVFGSTTLTSLGSSDVFLTKLAANGAPVWATSFGTVDPEEPTSVAAAPDGSVYVASKSTYNLSAPGQLSRFSANGAPSFTAQVGIAPSVAAAADGSALVTGWFSGMLTLGSTTLTSLSADVVTAKFSSNGTVVWVKQIEKAWTYPPPFISASSAGTTYVSHYFSGVAHLGSTTLTAEGPFDALLVKYESNGALAWAKQGEHVMGTGVEVKSVSTLADGTSYVAGTFTVRAKFGSTVLTSAGGSDAFIAKYWPNGSLAWAQRAGGIADDSANGVATLPDGSLYVTGSVQETASFGDLSVNALSVPRAFLAKYDTSGAALWVTLGGDYDTFGDSVSVLPNGSAYVAGHYYYTTQFGNFHLTNSNATFGAFLAKFNADGSVAWLTGPRSNRSGLGVYARSVSALPDGTAYVTGGFVGDTVFGTTTLSGLANANVFLAKYGPSGTLLWAKDAGYTNGQHEGTSVAALPDGTALVAGIFDVEVIFEGATTNLNDFIYVLANGLSDVFVAKFAVDGPAVWAHNVGSSSRYPYASLTALADGSSYLTGTEEAALLKQNADGSLAWTVPPTGTKTFGRAVAADGDGAALLTGALAGRAVFGQASLSSAPTNEAFLARYVR